MNNTFNINEVTSWVGILALCGGIYCLYSCIMMKIKGEINEGLLLNKEVRYKKCKDKDAYIKEVFPAFLTFSILTICCGAIDMINTFVTPLYKVYVASLVLFVLGFAWFMVQSKKSRDKYY